MFSLPEFRSSGKSSRYSVPIYMEWNPIRQNFRFAKISACPLRQGWDSRWSLKFCFSFEGKDWISLWDCICTTFVVKYDQIELDKFKTLSIVPVSLVCRVLYDSDKRKISNSKVQSQSLTGDFTGESHDRCQWYPALLGVSGGPNLNVRFESRQCSGDVGHGLITVNPAKQGFWQMHSPGWSCQ